MSRQPPLPETSSTSKTTGVLASLCAPWSPEGTRRGGGEFTAFAQPRGSRGSGGVRERDASLDSGRGWGLLLAGGREVKGQLPVLEVAGGGSSGSPPAPVLVLSLGSPEKGKLRDE